MKEMFILKRDPYDVLGVDKNCSDEVLKKAWSDLCKKYHPDANPDDTEGSRERFEEIMKAFDTIEKERAERAPVTAFSDKKEIVVAEKHSGSVLRAFLIGAVSAVVLFLLFRIGTGAFAGKSAATAIGEKNQETATVSNEDVKESNTGDISESKVEEITHEDKTSDINAGHRYKMWLTGSFELGKGFNDNNEYIHRTLVISLDISEEKKKNADISVETSWGASSGVLELNVHGDTYDYEHTRFDVETLDFEWNGYEKPLVFAIYLPDDPSIAGEQTITLNVGETVISVPVTLIYSGDYVTDIGWIVYGKEGTF